VPWNILNLAAKPQAYFERTIAALWSAQLIAGKLIPSGKECGFL
jgi:hypothetical protein